ncbi:MAG: hypothetical protein ACLGIR_00520 [Actinomycetes bacterium]
MRRRWRSAARSGCVAQETAVGDGCVASRARTDFSLTVMVAPAPGAASLGGPTAQARVLYDATGFDATVKVTCLPEDEPGVEDETCEI